MSAFWEVTLGGLIGSGAATTVLGALFMRRNARVAEEMKAEFSERLTRSSSTRAYNEKALEELFGPAKMQLGRTRRAFSRWNKRSDHIETNVIRQGNLTVRDLLLAKGHLLPPSLLKDAEDLIEHCDAWLEKYEEERVKNPSEVAFIYVGPDGYPFPRSAEQRLIAYAEQLQTELYGEVMSPG